MKITLCGSMAFHANMEELKQQLEEYGHEIHVPLLRVEVTEGGRDRKMSIRQFLEENGGIDSFPHNHEVWDWKTDAIDDHFEKVKWSDAVLIANYTKYEIEGYVGGNTLMEMAVARLLRRSIYLLFPVSSGLSYKEEIMGMKPIVLEGDLRKIK